MAGDFLHTQVEEINFLRDEANNNYLFRYLWRILDLGFHFHRPLKIFSALFRLVFDIDIAFLQRIQDQDGPMPMLPSRRRG